MRPPDDDFRKAGHQPAAPDDLAAFPPTSPECAGMRDLLRDFVDGELSVGLRTEVETHVHGCRSCALALSRVESEWLQITSSLAEVDLDGPSADFTASVMRQAREIAVDGPSVGFTRRVMARVRETALAELVAPAKTTAGAGIAGRWPLWLTLAATVALAVLLGLRVFESRPPVAVEVLAARDAMLVRGGVSHGLAATDLWNSREHRPGDRFVTGRGGQLALTLRPGSGKAAALRAGEQTSMRITAGGEGERSSVMIEDGELAVRTEQEMSIHLSDGSRLDLIGGDYTVSVDPVRHQDAREGVRVEVRVGEGAASVVRGDRVTLLRGGRIGRYTTFTSLYIDTSRGDDLFAASRRRGAQNDPAEPRVTAPAVPAFGQLLDPRTATPVADATVIVSHFLGSESVQTDAEGRFWVSQLQDLRSQFVLVRAVPPTRTGGVAPMDTIAVFVDGRQGDSPRRFFLRGSGQLAGRIHDDQGRAVPGLTVQVCRVDEVLGTVMPIGNPLAVGSGGNFSIPGLSAEPVAHQSLVLVADAPGRPPAVVWAGAAVRVGDGALEIALPAVSKVKVGGFAPSAIVHLLLPVDGLPVQGVVAGRKLTADATGQIALELAERMYVLAPDGPPRVARLRAGGALEFLTEAPPAALRSLRIGSVAPHGLHWFRATAALGVAHVPTRGGGFLSVQEQVSGQACPGSSVVQRTATGRLVFLGVFDGRSALACADGIAGELLVRTPEGWVGDTHLGEPIGRVGRVVSVQRPGRVRWQGLREAIVVLQRLTSQGEWTPVVRSGRDSEWVLQAGEYRVGGQQVSLLPGSVLILQ